MKEEFGLIPNAYHCLHIVNLFGWARRLADAEDFVAVSSFDKEPMIMRALLQICQMHGDIDMGICVGEKLLDLDPSAVTSYTLLYNMYMDVGKVSLAMRTRGLMRERGLDKASGVCWIEVGAFVHSFVDGDTSYPEHAAIFAKLESLRLKIKEMGHTDAKGLERNHQSKKWNDSSKSSHAERLAVAFGLISLPDIVPVRVMSSMRPCGDCHTLLKLFSKIENRRIVLRDPTRFHSFELGSCSCGDFW